MNTILTSTCYTLRELTTTHERLVSTIDWLTSGHQPINWNHMKLLTASMVLRGLSNNTKHALVGSMVYEIPLQWPTKIKNKTKQTSPFIATTTMDFIKLKHLIHWTHLACEICRACEIPNLLKPSNLQNLQIPQIWQMYKNSQISLMSKTTKPAKSLNPPKC